MTELTAAVPEGEARPSMCVLLLIRSDRNRELLANQLSEEFETQTLANDPFADPQFDICLTDTPSLREHGSQLEEAKTAAAPTFLPYLLLARRSPDEFPPEIWEVVDEVIERPMSQAVLKTRLSNLLQRRRLSLELTRQKEQSEQRFKALFQSTPDPVVVITPDGTITGANEAFTETFGLERDEILSQSIRDLELVSDEPVKRVLLRIAEGDSSTTTIEWSLDEEDSLVTELNTDIVTGLGETTERIGIFRDITKRVEREEELERQNERLDEFADMVAHDLRNPLHVAQAQLGLARETGDDRHFDMVDRAQGRMEQMIDELLMLAKQGQAVLEATPVSVEEAANHAWRNVETSDATLDIDIEQSDTIMADEGRFTELLENLIRNAIEHGGEAVTVRIGLLLDDPGFYIEDDGPGIPPEKREEVFETGYTEAEDGTGFGLSIVQQIVDGHEWTMSVTQSEMDGARFEITDVEVT